MMGQRFWLGVGVIMIMATLLFTTWRNAITTNLLHIVTSRAIFRLDSSDSITDLPFARWVSPRSMADYMWEAETYSAYQAWDRAQATYQKYRELGGDPKPALRRLVQIASVRNWCLTQNQMLLTLATTLGSKADAYQAWGDACTANRQIGAALDAYRQAFGISPDRVIAGKLAGVLFERAQATNDAAPDARLADFAEVVEVLKSVSLQPDDSHNYYLLAWSEWQLNQFDEAIVAYEKCLATPRQADRYAFACALNLGYAYSAWLPAASWDLQKADFYYHRAQVLAFDDGSRLEAQNALQRLEGLEQ